MECRYGTVKHVFRIIHEFTCSKPLSLPASFHPGNLWVDIYLAKGIGSLWDLSAQSASTDILSTGRKTDPPLTVHSYQLDGRIIDRSATPSHRSLERSSIVFSLFRRRIVPDGTANAIGRICFFF